jgi:hypothetical protein
MRRRFVTLWSATALPYMVMMPICFLPGAFIGIAYLDRSKIWINPSAMPPMRVLAKLGVLLSTLACTCVPTGFATAGATIVVWADLQGETVDVHSILSRIGHVFLRLTGLCLCIGFTSLIGEVSLFLNA